MNDFKNKILEGITSGEIKAESKWRFLAHDYFFWFLAGTSTVLGAIAISSILHRVSEDQAPLAPHLRELETMSVFVQTLPFLWLGLLALLAIAAWFNFKKTSNAYKHQLVVLLGMLVVAMLFGGTLFAAGVGGAVDTEVRKRVPAFQKQQDRRQQLRKDFLERRGKGRVPRLQNDNKRPYPIAPPQRIR